MGWGDVPPPAVVAATLGPHGVEVQVDRPVDAVHVRSGDTTVIRRALATPSATVSIPGRPAPGELWTIEAGGGVATVRAPLDPLGMWIEAPRGQGRVEVSAGDAVAAWAFGEGGTATLGLVAHTAPQQVDVRWGGATRTARLDVVGQVVTVDGPLADGPIDVGGRVVHLDVRPWSAEAARSTVQVLAWAFPADPQGAPLPARPADVLVWPAAPIRQAQRWLAGVAIGDPVAWHGVTLRNDGDRPLAVVVDAAVVGDGAEAFAPQVRDRTGLDRVAVTATLPPGRPVQLALPLYVDPARLRGEAWTRRLRVTPLGASEALHTVDAPLRLQPGSAASVAGVGVSLGVAAVGWGGMAYGGRAFLRRQPTSDLVVIALFAAVSYVTAGALQVVGHGVAALLGPFAPFVTALADDALRACLIGTLVHLMPRPGVVALSTVLGALLRGLTLGSMHPADLLYVGTTVVFLESALWVAGPTRFPEWRDRSARERWWRLGLGLGLANVAGMATGLAVAAVVYRLYYAPWYVAMLLAGPGFLYVLAGARVAVVLATSVRRVAA